jgi:cytochrome b
VPPLIPVWDRCVRMLHWALVLAVAGAWLSTFRYGAWHQPVGYLALALVLLRLLWGAVGSRYARFTQFVRSPPATAAYLRLLLQRREPRHIGHNPLGGWMVLALLGCVTALALTGWLYTTDRYWGDERVEALHKALAWTLLALIALHLAGALYTSRRHRENLGRAMVCGAKRAPGPGDVS